MSILDTSVIVTVFVVSVIPSLGVKVNVVSVVAVWKPDTFMMVIASVVSFSAGAEVTIVLVAVASVSSRLVMVVDGLASLVPRVNVVVAVKASVLSLSVEANPPAIEAVVIRGKFAMVVVLIVFPVLEGKLFIDGDVSVLSLVVALSVVRVTVVESIASLMSDVNTVAWICCSVPALNIFATVVIAAVSRVLDGKVEVVFAVLVVAVVSMLGICGILVVLTVSVMLETKDSILVAIFVPCIVWVLGAFSVPGFRFAAVDE